MKILIVAMAGSIHTMRWIHQIEGQGWDISLFPSHDTFEVHDDLPQLKLVVPFYSLYKWASRHGYRRPFIFFYRGLCRFRKKMDPLYYEKRLAAYIRRVKPDVVHSLETQGAGYLVDNVRRSYFTGTMPPWWHTNWGSDIHLWGRLPDHTARVRSVLENCNYYSCECRRDIVLAKEYGFRGVPFPVYPNTGGIGKEVIADSRKHFIKPSERKCIMLKGYQGWAGRALVGIRALARCKDVLAGYTIFIHTNTSAEDIRIAAALLAQELAIPVILLPGNSAHSNILQHHGNARISIGLSISDGISTSLLEAMAMGAFPIQSCTACASDWISDGITGFIVPPEDPDIIETAIRKALADDALVDTAAQINITKIQEDANFEQLQQLTIQAYQTIYNNIAG